MMRIVPGRLCKGDKIGLVSPGRRMALELLNVGVARLQSLGYEPDIDRQNYLQLYDFAGSDRERASAVQSMLERPDVKAVMFTQGGYGTLRIIDHIDYERVLASPKIVIGYSDITALLISLRVRAGLVTYHGPMLYDLSQRIDDKTWKWFEETLVTAVPSSHNFGPHSGVGVIRPGEGEGELLGGNLTLLTNLIGTGSDFITDGCILFLEDCDEELYAIDRMLVHLSRNGKLRRPAALLIGQMKNISERRMFCGGSIAERLLHTCDGTDYPIIFNFPFGHESPQLTLPIGIRAQVEASPTGAVRFRMLEPPVEV